MAETVADAVADGLVDAGATRLFVVDSAGAEITAAARRRGLDVVDVTSASVGAVMAAITGELGDGPGVLVLDASAAEAASGLAYASAIGAPMLVVSETALAPAAPFTAKASIALSANAASLAASAARLARNEPCGPVHLIVGSDVAARPAEPRGEVEDQASPPTLDAAALAAAAGRLEGAARPVLIAGAQCRSGLVARWLRALAEAMPAPVIVTAKARGVLPDPHPLVMTGDAAESLLGRADLVVAIGLDSREQPPSTPDITPVVHFTATPPQTGGQSATVVLGDVALIIEELAPRLRGRSRADWDVAELDRLKRAARDRVARAGGPAERVVALVRELTPAGTIATADGEAGGPATLVWQATGPNELFVAAPGPPAFAAAAAVAAALARPHHPAVAFTDVSNLSVTDAALAVAAGRHARVLIVALGAPAADSAPATIAARQRVVSVAAPTEQALAAAVTRALATKGPCLIDARTGRGSTSPV